MEFEDVSEQINWEARRIMAACGSKSCRPPKIHKLPGQEACAEFSYGASPRKHALVILRQGKVAVLTISYIHSLDGRYKSLCSEPSPLHKDQLLAPEMARVLYKLGYAQEWIEEKFDRITAHEKLELRLSLPHEFWPKTWLDEERV